MAETVKFLESIKGIFPDILSVISDLEARTLDTHADEPFNPDKVNVEFVHAAEARYVSAHTMTVAKNKLKAALMEPERKGKLLDIEKQEKLIEASTKVKRRLAVPDRLVSDVPDVYASLAYVSLVDLLVLCLSTSNFSFIVTPT